MAIEYRVALEDDLKRVVEMKKAMFLEFISSSDDLRSDFNKIVRSDYRALLREKNARHFLACNDGEIVACAGAFVKSDAPYRYFRNSRYGHIGDVFTEPAFRRRGIAKTLSESAIAWLFEQGVTSIQLKASNAGRSIYESLGFEGSDQMILGKDL